MQTKTREILEKKIGITLSNLKKMTADEINQHIEKKTGTKIRFSRDQRMAGAGSILLAEGRVCTVEERDKRLDEMAMRLKKDRCSWNSFRFF